MTLEFFTIDKSMEMALPLFGCPVAAGFPSPADDFIEIKLDLNQHLVKNPSSTFYARVRGNSMSGVRIYDGDLLIVDRSLEPEDGKIAVCVVNGEFTAKLIEKRVNGLYLVPANTNYSSMRITEDASFQVWGIVTYVIHKSI